MIDKSTEDHFQMAFRAVPKEYRFFTRDRTGHYFTKDYPVFDEAGYIQGQRMLFITDKSIPLRHVIEKRIRLKVENTLIMLVRKKYVLCIHDNTILRVPNKVYNALLQGEEREGVIEIRKGKNTFIPC